MSNKTDLFDGPELEFSADRVIAYLKGTLSRPEVLSFEKYLAANPFAMDAIEGLQHLDDPEEIRSILERNQNQKTESQPEVAKKPKGKPPWILVLLIPILFVAGYFIGRSLNQDSKIENAYAFVQNDLKNDKPKFDHLTFQNPELLALYNNGDYGEVLAKLELPVTPAGNAANDLGLTGIAALYQGDYQKAINYLKESINLNPNQTFAYYQALSLIQQKDKPAAKSLLQELLNLPDFKFQEDAKKLIQLLDNGD